MDGLDTSLSPIMIQVLLGSSTLGLISALNLLFVAQYPKTPIMNLARLMAFTDILQSLAHIALILLFQFRVENYIYFLLARNSFTNFKFWFMNTTCVYGFVSVYLINGGKVSRINSVAIGVFSYIIAGPAYLLNSKQASNSLYLNGMKTVIQVILVGVLFMVGLTTTFYGLFQYGQKFKYLTSRNYVLFRESIGYLLSINLLNLLIILPILVFQITSTIYAFVSPQSTNPEIFHIVNFVQLMAISLRGVIHLLYTYFGYIRRYATKDGKLEISSPVVDYRTSRILSPALSYNEKPTPFMDPALRRPSLPR